ncbi:hypothetical protein QN277_002333 [Acacia crassicarpa]|uniref:Protein kinase domain-containing protein n=1 Tax=Acacia crassicarpa TaxID=499986 RepID=A0AAE1TJG0_9FABA|nr:hypothetical protein QN277_002333 [Acacia crassicarpa]
MEPRNEELHSAPQSTVQDRLEGMRINMRPADRNMSDKKPVLNYSIQTGEEFALEFMRDRVNLRQPVFPNIMGDPNYATGYMEFKGILGINHSGSETGSDISMIPKVEKGPKEFDRRSSSMQRDRSNYGSIRTIPRNSSNQENNRVLHGLASSGPSTGSSMKMKVLCSFGGKILPRPSDGKLRYVGGETRIISIRRDITWQELMQKALSLFNETHAIKYQLPGEDLDALVSVSSDEDLRNMMEECNDLNRAGSQKLRMFLFSMVDMDDPSVDGDTEVQYVVAVNGMDLGSRNHSFVHAANASADNLHELDGQNIEREASRTQIESTGAISSSWTANANSSLGIQSSQPVIPTASTSAYESNMLFHSNHHGESSQYPVHYGVDSSNNSAFRQIPVSLPTHVPNNQGIVNDGHPPEVLQAQNSEMPAIQVKKRGDSSIKHEGDSGKGLSSETLYPVPPQPFDGNLPGNFSEASVTNAVQGAHLHKLPSKSKGKHQQYEEASSFANAVNSTQIPKSVEDDLYSTSTTNAFNPSYVDAGSNVIDLSCLEPPALPNRVYYSERIPREQADLLNRSTKSDDAYGSQALMSDLFSDLDQQNSTAESSDKFQVGHLSNLTAVSSMTAIQSNTNGHAIDNGLARIQNHKQLPDVNNTDKKIAANEDWVLRSESDTNLSKDNHNNRLVDETKSTEHPVFHKVPSDRKLGDASNKEFSNDPKVQAQPFFLTGNMSQDVSQGLPTDAVSTPAQGDIMIDIEDRFPRDFLYDMFSKAIHSEDSSHISPLPTDGTGLSLNVENHEPKSWSYFQKLANEGSDNVSLIDQDHLGFSSALRKVKEGDSRSQQVAPPPADGVSVGHDFGKENQKHLPVTTRTEATVLQPNFDQTQVTETEIKNVYPVEGNTKVKDSEYEDGKNEAGNMGHPHDPSLEDIDISTLQLINNEDLEELKELGSGTFGTVYHGKWRGTDVAIKRIKKSCFTGRSSEQERLALEFWREADILSKLHHPNVVAFYGVVQDGPGGTLATVTEFMVDGSLRHVLLRKDRYLDRRKRLIIAMDAAFGMEYLHSKNIVHFDLKCDNLLVNLKDPLRPICKVGDFGLSKIKRNTLVSGGVRGTLPWMAPELLNGSSNKVSEKVDVFSFGIVLWEILTGEEPYANMHYGAIIGGIVNNTLRPTIPSYCDNEWRQLMEQCWAPNPSVRPSFTEIARRLRVMSAAASQTKGQGYKASK